MHQNKKHQAQTMQLYYNNAKKYKQIPSETGARLKYAIEELCIRPEKLSHPYKKRAQERETAGRQGSHQERTEWEDYQATLGKMVGKHIHSAKKQLSRKNQNGHYDERNGEREKK